MATFRLQNNVPDVYTRKSRDFQLFCALFDCMNNGIKFDINSIEYLTDTNQINERLLPYLQTKLGFWTKVKISGESLRIILKGFMYAVRNKGSIKGVEQAVQLFLKVKKIKTNVHIEVINESDDSPYTVIIGTDKNLGDTTILDEILKYILPAGYNYSYVYYANTSYDTAIKHADNVKIITGNPALLGAVRTTFINNEGNEIEYPEPYTVTDPIFPDTQYTVKNIIDNVNQTVISSNRVPTPSNTYSSNELIRDPESKEENNLIVTNPEDIEQLYDDLSKED